MVTAMKAGNITANALDRKPLLCNYIVLNVNQYHVTKIKMCKKNGTYKKYRTPETLRWHLQLTGLPDTAAISFSNVHYHELTRRHSPSVQNSKIVHV